MKYRQRHIEKKLKQYAGHFKAVLIAGARQVGKSTLLQRMYPKVRTFVFDPLQDLFGVRRDPDLFLDTFAPPLILDEIQYVPELLPALKRRIDQSDSSGQYFLTGSQNLSVLRSVSESLAGRVGILNIEGMTAFEMFDYPDSTWIGNYLNDPNSLVVTICGTISAPPLINCLWRGSMPGLLDMPDRLIHDYLRSYIETYVERDVRLLENIRELALFDRFLGLSGALSGQELNASQLGREIGITPATARRWLDLLNNTYQWLELFPYYGNTIKRISGKRKGYWRDTGIVCYLQRISSTEALAVSPMLGAIFETWAVNSIYRQFSLLPTPPQIYHWRSAGRAEVDLVLEVDGRLYPIEIKCKTTLSGHDTRGLRAFRDTYGPKLVAPGIIIYAGRECFRVDKYTTAVPWNAAGCL